MENNTGKNSIIMLAADTLTVDEIEAGTEAEWKGVRYEKQIALFGDYINPLFPVETMKIDETFADEMIANFNKKIKAHVTIPITHFSASDPSRNAGEVVELIKKDDGLYAVMEIRRWDSRFDIEEGVALDVSMGFDWDYIDTRTGEHHGLVLEHVALENDPYIEGMTGFVKTQEQLDKENAEREAWDDIAWLDEFAKQHKGSAIMLSKNQSKERNMTKAMRLKKEAEARAAAKIELSKVKNDREFDVVITVKDEDGEDVKETVAAGEEIEVPDEQADAVTEQIKAAKAPKPELNDDAAGDNTDPATDPAATPATDPAAADADDKKTGSEQLSRNQKTELARLQAKEKDTDAVAAYQTLLSAKKITPAQKDAFVELHKATNGQKVSLSRDGKNTEVNLAAALVDFVEAGTTKFSTDQSGSKKTKASRTAKPSEFVSDETAKGLEAQGVTAERMDKLAEKSPAYRDAMSKLNNKEQE